MAQQTFQAVADAVNVYAATLPSTPWQSSFLATIMLIFEVPLMRISFFGRFEKCILKLATRLDDGRDRPTDGSDNSDAAY